MIDECTDAFPLAHTGGLPSSITILPSRLPAKVPFEKGRVQKAKDRLRELI